MIRNPIIHKEVLSALRTRKAIAMQGLFFLIAALLVWRHWPADGLQDLGGQQAMQILSSLAIGEMVMIALFAPAFTATSLTLEKERNTLESLFATAMKPWEIALGKMIGSLCFICLLVVSGIPAIATVFLLGNVSGGTVVALIAILLLTAVYLGLIGLTVGVFMHRSYRAIVVTYGILLVVCFLFALPAMTGLISRGGTVWQTILHTLASFSPIQAVMSLIWPSGTSDLYQEAGHMPAFWKMYIPLSLLTIGVTATICLIKLRRPIAPPRPREDAKVVERNKFSGRSVLYMWFFDPRRRRRNIGPLQNPVLMKEFRSRPMLQTRWLMRAIATSLICSVLLMFLVNISVMTMSQESQTGSAIPGMMAGVAALMTMLVMLVGPAMSSGAICSDRETGVWDLMRTTRLSSWQIVSGKFQASIVPMLLLVLATTPALIILLYFSQSIWPNMLRILYVVGMAILFVSTAGTFFSSVFSKTSTATAWTYSLVIIIAMGSLIVLLDPEGFSPRLVRGIFIFNPIAAALSAAGYAAVERYGLVVSDHLAVMALATAAMFIATVWRVVQLRRAT